MARLPLRARRRRGDAERDGGELAPLPPTRRAPSPGALRRERRALLGAREGALRDLGGLLLEMYRRDVFREDLLRDRCADLVDLDVRLQEIEILLAGGDVAYTARCACGAPLVVGAHFCANCGRPAGDDAVVACAACGHPLPADARFCAACGSAAGGAPDEPAEGAANGAAPPASTPAARADPWEE